MTRVALIGAGGFVGSSILKALAAKADIDLALVTRTTYNAARDDGPYDILINRQCRPNVSGHAKTPT